MVRQFLQRIGLHGDLGPRFQAWAVSHCPFFLEPVFLAGYSLIFFLVAAPPRRAVMANLSVLFPNSTRLENALRAFRVFFSFASSATDAVRARQLAKANESDPEVSSESSVDWEVVGVQHFEKIADSEEGAIILTAHMGNYDVAAPVFSEKFRRRLNAVRAPEKTEQQQQYRQRELEGQQSESYSVRYNSPESVLGLELTQALSRGEFVAIQGDRILFEVSALDTPFDDAHSMAIPKGPFVLALTTRTLIHPLFILRLGRRRYRILIRPPIQCNADARGAKARDAAIRTAAAEWMRELAGQMREHWHQWYVFESAFKAEKDKPQESSSTEAGSDP
jgi:lauroyl/myristoyl acyltransferase